MFQELRLCFGLRVAICIHQDTCALEPAPEGLLTIAQRFSVGNDLRLRPSPEGTTEILPTLIGADARILSRVARINAGKSYLLPGF